MNLEKQVCSLELAKELKGLGVAQRGLFFWWINNHGQASLSHGMEITVHQSYVSYEFTAFTVAELGEMLPFFVNKDHVWAGQLMCVRHPHDWTVSYGTMKEAWIKESADTEADARAKMLIHLLKEKITTP